LQSSLSHPEVWPSQGFGTALALARPRQKTPTKEGAWQIVKDKNKRRLKLDCACATSPLAKGTSVKVNESRFSFGHVGIAESYRGLLIYG
jgi:hypothetical protein